MDLFGHEIVEAKKGDRKSVIAHKQLIAIYGEAAGKKCGACFHFYFWVYSKNTRNVINPDVMAPVRIMIGQAGGRHVDYSRNTKKYKLNENIYRIKLEKSTRS